MSAASGADAFQGTCHLHGDGDCGKVQKQGSDGKIYEGRIKCSKCSTVFCRNGLWKKFGKLVEGEECERWVCLLCTFECCCKVNGQCNVKLPLGLRHTHCHNFRSADRQRKKRQRSASTSLDGDNRLQPPAPQWLATHELHVAAEAAAAALDSGDGRLQRGPFSILSGANPSVPGGLPFREDGSTNGSDGREESATGSKQVNLAPTPSLLALIELYNGGGKDEKLSTERLIALATQDALLMRVVDDINAWRSLYPNLTARGANYPSSASDVFSFAEDDRFISGFQQGAQDHASWDQSTKPEPRDGMTQPQQVDGTSLDAQYANLASLGVTSMYPVQLNASSSAYFDLQRQINGQSNCGGAVNRSFSVQDILSGCPASTS